jgi:small subunit ribosomal protein S8
MSMTDPISDMLTRIRNACQAGHRKVDVPSSKIKLEICRILKERGFIRNYAFVDDRKQGYVRVYLKFSETEESAIQGLVRVSRPGLRQYVGKTEIPRVLNGLGFSILTTSRGVLTDREAARHGVGGEVICKVW